jgi:hypothetical protein
MNVKAPPGEAALFVFDTVHHEISIMTTPSASPVTTALVLATQPQAVPRSWRDRQAAASHLGVTCCPGRRAFPTLR